MSTPISAVAYFAEGIRLLKQPALRRYVIAPLIINLVIFILTSIWFFESLPAAIQQIMHWLPHWLDWLRWLIWPLATVCFVILYGYCFNLITNFIAAPFLGSLAEKVEAQLTGTTPANEPITQLVIRSFKRELTKLWYFLSRGILVLLVFLALLLIPGVNLLAMLLATLWSSWCLAIQYVDYAADNNHMDFYALRKRLAQMRTSSLSFGALALVGSMIPVVNLVITPVAVAGATVFWVREVNTKGA